jgi:AraC-like DNA-binding protein
MNIRKPDGFESQKLIVLPETLLAAYSSHPLIQPLHITDIGSYPEALYHYMGRMEGCPSYILIYCSQGEGWYSLDGGKIQTVTEQMMFVLPPHIRHEYGAADTNPWSIHWIHIRGELASSYFQPDRFQHTPAPIPAEMSRKWMSLFDDCYHALEKGITLHHMIYTSQVLGHLLGLTFFWQSAYGNANEKKALIDKTIDYMAEHLHTSLTLRSLAEQANLSIPHYVHLFKKSNGYSPIEYFLSLKMQRACQYLDLTDFTLKQISGLLGINDPYYFSRLFRKTIGLSPSEYRKRKKG